GLRLPYSRSLPPVARGTAASRLPSLVGLPPVGRLPRACSSRPPRAATRRHAPPHPIYNK
ncbi:hypothetical protein EXE42_10200, partial [Halorubrum sp. SP3]